MSAASQQNNMRRLHGLLGRDLGYIWGERESGPNGEKRIFLNIGKVFLRALAQDLGLRDAVVRSNPAGIGVSGDCTLYGMWEESGVYVCVCRFPGSRENVILYRAIHNIRDHRGGYNNYIRLRDLETMTYGELLARIGSVRRDRACERAA